jgi:hypothetical protein
MKTIKDASMRIKLFLTLGIIALIAVANAGVVLYHLDAFMERTEAILATRQLDDALATITFLDASLTNIAESYAATGGGERVRRYYAERTAQYETLLASMPEPSSAEDRDALARILAGRAELARAERAALALYGSTTRAGARTAPRSWKARRTWTASPASRRSSRRRAPGPGSASRRTRRRATGSWRMRGASRERRSRCWSWSGACSSGRCPGT